MRYGKTDAEIVEQWLFGSHKGYCAHESNWWTRWQHGESKTCICDEPREALARLALLEQANLVRGRDR